MSTMIGPRSDRSPRVRRLGSTRHRSRRARHPAFTVRPSRDGVPRAARSPRVRGLPRCGEHRTHAHEDEHPQTNGICDRFDETVLNEFYRVAFRKKLDRSLEQLRADLDAWLKQYNEERT